MTEILKYFPKGMTPRPGQRDALLEIEQKWDTNDVIVLNADVGAGKSAALQTIARWRASKGESTATLTPRVTLQDQYKASFKDIDMLQGKSRYKCKDSTFKSCHEKHEITENYCPGCPYAADRKAAKETKNGVFSVHSYLMLGERKDNLLCDEVHSLYSIMSDQMTLKLWQHKVGYPDGLSDYGPIVTGKPRS